MSIEDENSRRRREPPKMVNMDPSYNIPGSISQKEDFENELKRVSGTDTDDGLNKDQQPAVRESEPGVGRRRAPNFIDPEDFGHTPLVKGNNNAPKPFTNLPESQQTKKAPVPESVTPVFPDVTEAIATQDKLRLGEAVIEEPEVKNVTPENETTEVKAPAEFSEAKTEINDPNNYVLDHTRDEPLENEFTDENDVNNAEISDAKNDEISQEEIIPSKEPPRGQFTTLSEEEKSQDEKLVESDTSNDDTIVETRLSPAPTTEEKTEQVVESENTSNDSIAPQFSNLKEADEVEVSDDERREVSEEEKDVVEDVPDNLPEGSYVEGMTEVEALAKMLQEENELNKRIPVASSPRELNHAELNEIMDYTKTHYRIIQGITREKLLKRPVHVESGKVTIVKNTDAPDFELRRLNAEHGLSDGERRVQVVCTQSGYSVICKPMNSRELRTYGRDTRSQVTDSYNTNMAQAAAIYAKLSEFSCGAMTFEEFITNTAFPDLQTCIFGVYMATYPYANNFNLTCAYCQNEFTVPINNDTMICIPTGSTTQEMIRDVLSGQKDPTELIKSSKRYTGIDIYLNDNTRFFRVRTPSIAEFYDRAYRGKREDVIEENQADMYYAGYVRGYGILDIELFNRTGDVKYLYDDRIETIDREIAHLSPDDKRIFEQNMLNYINKYSVSYQIPRVKCPHCNKIMTQREINMKTLFFEVKAQKGL